MNDEFYMSRCLELAEKGRGAVSPNPLVGAVIVKNNQIIAEGYHQKFGGPHAEINALKQINFKAKGATLYCNLEPCFHVGKTPPCVEAVIASGIKRVVIAMADPNPKTNKKSIRKLKANGIEVTLGVMEKEARYLNRFFITQVTKKRPHIILKAAVTLDFKMATKTPQKIWLTGEEAIKDVHRLRREVDAVLVGVGTVLIDDPKLNVRYGDTSYQPVRIVLAGKRKVPQSAQIFKSTGGEVLVVSSLTALLKACTEKGLMSVLVEGGPTVMQSFLKAKLVDEVIYYVTPKLLDGPGKVMMESHVLLKKFPGFKFAEAKVFGSDLRLTYLRNLL